MEKNRSGNPAGAHWALYSELKARVEALGLRAEHCSLAVKDENGRCIAICHRNARFGYNADCTGKMRESTADLAHRSLEPM